MNLVPATPKDFERVAGGRIRSNGAGFVFVPTRRIGPWTFMALLTIANLLAWFAELSDALPAALSKSDKEFVPIGVCTLCLGAMIFAWRTLPLAWSGLAWLNRPLSVRKVEERGYREQTLYTADWGDVAVAPTTRRALFEIEFRRDFRLLVLVIGERAACLLLAPREPPSEGMSLVRILVHALELTPERLGIGVEGAIKRAGLSGTLRFDDDVDEEAAEVREGFSMVAAGLASFAWLGTACYFALRHHAALLTHLNPVSGSCALALLFMGPQMAFFAFVGRWISAPRWSRKAAQLVTATSRQKTWGEFPPWPLGGSSGTPA